MARVLADAVTALHFVYLAFLVFGGFLAWRWPKAIVVHLLAVVWGVAIVATGPNCPLTWVEDRLRRWAGEGGLPGGFINTYVEGVLYPQRYTPLVRLIVAGLVLVSWVGAYLMARRRQSAPSASSKPVTSSDSM
jgi:hypothetical protein